MSFLLQGSPALLGSGGNLQGLSGLQAIAPAADSQPAFSTMGAGNSTSSPNFGVASNHIPRAGVPMPNSRESSIISEVIVAGLWHDPGQDNNESNTWDLNAEIIFDKITYFQPDNRYLRFFVTPRPFIGGSLNNEGETHTVYTGLNWMYQFENNLFIAGTFGFTYHTGNLEQEERQCAPGEGCTLPGNRAFVDNGEVTLGSRILFRESIDIGYRFYDRHGISIFAAHISNGSLFDEDNDGMNFVGLRYSYSFD